MEKIMNEPNKRPMTNGPVQKKVKKYRMADSMTTHPGDEATIEWLKNKQYPTAGENEDNQKSDQT
jgi:hypothetical protein